ncbi:hypothetical protein TTHT_1466 [Thermotomaculum hydrothermale]|uniref:Fimbrial assembly family protein n=1 Tax=Thermotomaculum hydrothermale TaxID=981385 RepID=A0A7R6PFV7_9BACT|nr:PilN domain-containing protein [Thermotomaculum hydrothermale]BBB32974.1 hypothetical protein TTHT_1466 [Thermotomaculum hydrothermale]
MEFLEKLIKKRFRLIYKDIDIAFKKDNTVSFVDEDEVDDTFYTFGFVPVEYSVMYSLILPAAAEEHVDEIVKNFVKENEPSDVELKIDYSFVKEKGKLKVLIGVLKSKDYEELRTHFYNHTHTLSGIIPYQMILISHALKNQVKDGLAIFKRDGYILGFLFKDGFPVSFLKVKDREGINVETIANRFLSSERVEEETKIYFFGKEFEGKECDNCVFLEKEINFADDFCFLIDSKTLPIVNYLPPKERKVIRRWWRYIIASIIIVACVIYSGMFLKDYFTLRKEVNGLKSNFEAKKKIALELRKKAGNIEELKTMVNYFTKIEKEKKKILILLEELTRKIPKDAYLTRISINFRGELELNGKAKDVYAVVKALNNSKYFRNVEKKSSRESGDYTIFIIRGKVVY